MEGRLRWKDGAGGRGLEGAVVWLQGYSEAPPTETPKLVQKDKRFQPEILAIVAGQSVAFPNDDAVLHNVFSVSKARPFDLGKFRRGTSKSVEFDKTGMVEVFCDIHESMTATLLVLPNRAFGRAAADGSFALKGARPGTWTLRVWHRGAEPASLPVTVEAGKAVSVELELAPSAAAQAPHLDKYGRPYRARGQY